LGFVLLLVAEGDFDVMGEHDFLIFS
jgi:hypothetical protein